LSNNVLTVGARTERATFGVSTSTQQPTNREQKKNKTRDPGDDEEGARRPGTHIRSRIYLLYVSRGVFEGATGATDPAPIEKMTTRHNAPPRTHAQNRKRKQ